MGEEQIMLFNKTITELVIEGERLKKKRSRTTDRRLRENLELEMKEVRFKIQNIEGARQYATGKYTTKSLLSYIEKKTSYDVKIYEVGELKEYAPPSVTERRVPIEQYQYEAFRKQGYTAAQAEILTRWSMKYQMSPTKETARKILAGRETGVSLPPTRQPVFSFAEAARLQKEPFSFARAAEEYRATLPSIKTSISLPTEGISIYRQDWGESFFQSIKRIPSGTKQVFGSLVKGEFGKVSKDIEYVFQPFGLSGELKKEKEVTIAPFPWRGTIIDEQYTPQIYKGFTGTFEELEEQKKITAGISDYPKPQIGGYFKLSRDISSKLASKYQEKISSGELTLEQAEKEYGIEYKKEYERESKVLQQKYLTLPSDLYERTGAAIPKYAPIGIKIGALIGASFTPAGGVITSSYLIGRGGEDIVKAPDIKGKILGATTIGLGLYGGGAVFGSLRRSVTAAEIQEALAFTPTPSKGLRLQLGKATIDYKPSIYQFGSTKVFKETLSTSIYKSKGLAEIKGYSGVQVKSYEFLTGKPIYYSAGYTFKGTGKALEVVKEGAFKGFQTYSGFGKISKEFEILSYPEMKQAFPSKWSPLKTKEPYTKVDIFTKDKEVKDLFFGGVSKKIDSSIGYVSGDVKATYSVELKKMVEGFPSKRFYKDTGFLIDVKDFGRIKVITPPIKTDKVGVSFKGTGKKTPFSKTFQETAFAPPVSLEPPKAEIKAMVKTTQPIPIVVSKKPDIKPQELEPTIKPSPIQKPALDLESSQKFLKPSEEIILSQTPLEISTQKTRLRTIIGVKEKQVPILKQTQALTPTTKIKQTVSLAQPQALKLQQKLRQPQALKTSLITGDPFIPSFTPPFVPTWGGVLIPFALPFPKLIGDRRRIKVVTKVRPTKYQPTLRAKALGIKAPLIPKAYFRGAGGIIERPIVKVKKKKKKKK